jgi:hypothetical protein
MKTAKERLLEAMATPNPAGAVLTLAVTLRDEGMGQVEMYRLFSEQQERLDGNDPL